MLNKTKNLMIKDSNKNRCCNILGTLNFYLLLMGLWCIIPLTIQAQDITLTTQSGVDTIRNRLGESTVITGNLTIGSSSNITHLDSLYFLTEIRGNWMIQNNSILENIVGFDSLTNIGGSLLIEENPSLRKVHAFSVLRKIGDDYQISNNADLEVITGLPVLDTILGDFSILGGASARGHTSLDSLGDYSSLRHIDGNFRLDSNSFDPVFFGDFSMLETIGGRFQIHDNTRLRDTPQFPRLTSIGKNISISNNDSLRSLYDFPSLTNIGTGSPYLPSLNDFLDNVSIVVEDNSQLEYCCVLTRLHADLTISGDSYIGNNFEGCNSTEMSSCNSSVRLSVGDTLLLPYNSIDTTFTLYSNTRWRLSKLNPVDPVLVTSLSSGGVSNSDSLISERDARIMVNYSPNTSGESRMVRLLISFLDTMDVATPADTLTLIQESAVLILEFQSPSAVNVGYERGSVELTFRFNTRWRLRKSDPSVNWITMLSDGTTNVMDTLEGGRIGDFTTFNDTTVTITYERAPTSASRSTTLTLVTIDANGIERPFSTTITITQSRIPAYIGNTYIGNITLINQEQVDTIRNTLGRYTAITGNLTIGRHSSNITHLDSLYFLTEIGGYIYLQRNRMLESIVGFDSLTNIGGGLFITENRSLRKVHAFLALRKIGGGYQISNNANLEVITGLPVLDTILGRFSILGGASARGHTSLDSLGDYSSLRHIGGNFRLGFNSFDPVFLGDFSMLETIGGRFQIHDNTRLRDTPQFPRLTSIDKGISISNNDSLRYLYEFPTLTSVGADSLRVNNNNASIVVEDNSQLEYCCVLTGLREGGSLMRSGDVFISNNFEGCNISDDEDETNCNLSVRLSVDDTVRLPFFSEETVFTLYSNTRWQLSRLNPGDADWVTSLSSGGVSNSDSLISERDARIMVNYTPNTNSESRMVQLLISFLDETGVATPADTLTLIQEGTMPTFEFQSPSAVNVGYERDSVELTFRFNTKWRLRKSDPSVNWITMLSDGTTNVMDSLEGGRIGDFTTFNDTTVTITYERAPTSASRSTELTLVAIDVNGIELQFSTTITITQSGIPAYIENTYIGDIRLTTQAEVDTIRNTLGRYTAITGNLTIGHSSNITHLDSLYFLTEIRGNFIIEDNDMLESIVGFDSLTKVGNNLEIKENSSLTHISLSALDTVGGNFHIQDNAPLDTLGDYRSLRHIGGYFNIFSFKSSSLVDLGNFSMLENIGGYFELYRNENLVNVGNFPMLDRIGGYFSVNDNKILRSLYDFPALTSIGVGNGAYIPSLDERRDNVSIVVDSNPLLEYCCILTKIRERGITLSGDSYISNNFEGCNSTEMSSCNLSVRLSVGDTLLLPYNSIDTTFTLYSNTRWQLSKLNPMDADWASLSSGGVSNSDSLISERDARIMVNYSPNISGESRMVRLLISFLDTMDVATPADTLTLIQESAVPILEFQSSSAVNVGYERGSVGLTFRSNTRWRLRKSDPSVNWITMLSNVMDSLEGGRIGDFTTFNDTTVTITYERAPTSDSRSAELTLVAIDNNDDELQDSVNITITQAGIPPVYVGNIRLTTQAEVNRIRTTLSGATAITGFLLIGPAAGSSPDITDLSPLYFLTEIRRNFTIEDNDMLESIVGFDSLTNIGGFLVIQENPSLRKVHAFSALRKIGGDYQILNNTNLEVITGLPVLDTILGGFSILGGSSGRGHTSLDSLGDYSSLRHIGGNFRLGFNSFDPVFLGDFSMLETIGGRFQIYSNTRLRDTPQFPRLTSIDKGISISNNDSLRYLYEFPALTSVGVDILIENRDSLSISVRNNPLLEYCCILTKTREGGSLMRSSDVFISNNFEGCNSIEMSSCNLSVRLSVDDTVRLPFFSEETVFTLYSNARWRLSNLNPGDADWASLSSGGVNNSDSLTLNRDARIRVNYTPNTNGESRTVRLLISFLDTMDVATPADTLTLIQEGTMPTFEFKSSSADVGYERGSVELAFRFNTRWRLRKSDTSVNWITMDSLEGGRIGDFTAFNDTTVTITYDEASTSSSRSTTLTLVAIDNNGNELSLPVNITITQGGYPYYGGDITLMNQAQVDTIRNTLGSSTAIRGNLIIGGTSSDITDLSPLNFLLEVTGNFEIRQNSMLEDVGDFPVLDSIGGYFLMHSNSILRNAGDFPVLKHIGGYFLIRTSDSLTSVGSFPRLTTIGESFSVRGTKILRSLYDFPSLTNIGTGRAYVPSRGRNILNASIVVEDNPLLEYCCVLTRLREGIMISGFTYVNNNFEGCNSIAMSNCNLSVRLSVDDTVRFPFFSEETDFTLYSNARWQLSKLNPGDADWVTSLSSGVGEGVADNLVGARDTRIKVNHTQNLNSESRMAQLLISFLDTMDVATPADTLTLIQEGTVPAFKFQPSNAVNVGHERDSVELTFRFNTRWRLRKSDTSVNWITMLSDGMTNVMDSLEGNTGGDLTIFNDTMVTITYEGAPTSVSRSTELTLVAIHENGIERPFSTTITITQSGIPAYPENITLINQAQVDTIRNTLGRATVIGGNLTIGPSNNITHLDSLYFLTGVRGNLEISNNSMLEDVGEFPALDSIGGYFLMHSNAMLRNGGDFPMLSSIGGYFLIRASDSLTSIGSFPRLATVGGYFSVRGAKTLRSLYDFPSLTNIGRGSAWVPSVSSTTNLSLNGVSIVVEDNPLLEYCCVLTRLREGGGITISGSRYINNNFEGCSSIAMSSCNLSVRLSVGDTVRSPFFSEETAFTLYSNARWQLSRLNPGDADWVTSLSSGGVSNSDSLISERDARIMVNHTPNINRESRTVRLLISFLDEMDVATPADTLTLIQGLKESTLQSASAVNVSHVLGRTEINILSNVRWRLHKSEEVDWLTILSSGTTNVTDSLEGGQSSVILPEVSVVTLMHEAVPTSSSRSSDLILSAIDSNGMELSFPPSITITVTQLGIPPPYTNDVRLRTQADINNIRTTLGRSIIIDANLIIEESSANTITDLSPLNFLTEVTGNFEIRENSALTHVGDFPDLRRIGGRCLIFDNNALETVSGFSVLDSLGGNFRVISNAKLASLGNYTSLRHINGSFIIGDPNRINPSLKDVGSFPVLTTLAGNYEIYDNDSLEVINGFPSLDSLGGNFQITRNAKLASLGNYSSLRHINGNFFIGNTNEGNSAVMDIGDFPFLQKIGGNYYVTENPELVNGGNFPVLDSIGGYFFIRSNGKLTSVGSYPNLRAIGGYLSIRSNDSLRSLYNFPSLTSIGTGNPYVPSGGDEESNTSIVVEDNSQLEYCCVLTRLREGGDITISGRSFINDNFEGCNSIAMSSCDLSVRLSVEKTLLLPYSFINTTFTAYSNAQWRLSKLNPGDADWITSLASGGVSNSDSLILDRDATITLTYSQNLSGVSRTAKFLISFLDTMGNVLTSPVPDTLTLIQEDQLPKIRLISPNENINIPYHSVEPIDITFAIGGTAANWTRSEITYTPDGNENFITINPRSFVQMGIVMIGLTPTVNTGAERMAVFTLYPAGRTGISVTITITQAGAPPTLMLSAPNIVNIPNTATTTSDSVEIEFTVGGGATAWWATVIDGDKFLTLESDTIRGSAGTNTIRVTATENTGGARMDTVIITTMGGFGASLKDTVVITQEGASIQAPNDTAYVGDIIVITQEQVDALLDTLAGKTIIDGNLTIGHTDETSRSNITNVTPLSNIVRITGYVRIQQNGQLVNLNALNNLQSIGESFEISYNDTLTTLGNFSALQTIGGGFGVWSNAKLPTLGDFPALQTVGGYFNVNNNDTLTTFGDFPTLQSIGGGFRVKNNAKLPTLGNFSTLQSIGEYFEIKNNATLPTLGNFSTLQTIGGYFNVNNNDTLTTLGNFSTLQSIGGYFNVNDNDSLTTLGNFSALQTIGGDFSVFANDELATLGDFTALQTIGENFEVNNNDTLTTLGNFSALQTIGGYFNVNNNDTLTTLGNFPALRSIGLFNVFANDELTTLGNFSALQSIEGYFSVFANDELATLGDFTALDSIRGYFNVDNNDTLTTLGNFPLLQTIGGVFNVLRNDRLTNLGDFPALVSIGMNDSVHISSLNGRRNDVSIVVEENPILFTCCFLTEFLPGGTHAVNGQIFINSNAVGCNSESEINATTLTLTSSNESITHNDTNLIAIDFIVGCGATGWTSAITYTPANANFITLSSTEGTDQTGVITIMATPTENTGVERTATITLSTTGGTASQTVVITQAGAPPMLRLTSNNRETLAHDAESANAITFNIGGGSEGWSSEITYSEGADEFIMLTGDETMRRDVRVIVASKVNTGTERAATIRISTEGGTGDAVDTVITIIQEAIPTISVTDPSDGMISIDYNDTIAQTITFDVGGSATGWRVTSDNDFVTLLSMSGDSGRNISVTATTTKNRDVERTATITFITRGQLGDSVTAKVTIMQNRAPGAALLDIISPSNDERDTVVAYMATILSDSLEIVFKVEDALGWASMISYGTGVDDFVTLSDTVNVDQTGEVRIKAAVMENESVERIAMLTLSTTGQSGDSATSVITIIQRGAPPMLRLTSNNRETLAHDAEAANAITFNIGGGATGWSSTLAGDNFITLTGEKDMRGDVTVTVASRVNTGVERSATITIATVGGTGEAVDTVITITQEAVPRIVVTDPSDGVISIDYNDISAQTITFDVGGSARGWTASSNRDFVTLDNERGNTVNTGLMLMATFTAANNGAARTATITISTTGQLGIAKTTTVLMTQREPTVPLLTNLNFTDGDSVTIAHNMTTETAITFDVGGNATGWTAVSSNESFITVDPAMGIPAQNNSVTATPEGMNTGIERSATITISTTGPEATTPVTATLTITQGGAPPTFMLTSANTDTLAHNATVASAITFNIGGGAEGWSSDITYGEEADEFIMLTGDETMRGNVSVTVASRVNTGVERSATITIATVGGTGEAVDTVITIAQEAGPPKLTLTSGSAISIATPSATISTDSIGVIFTVGGGASGWMAEVIDRDNSNNFLTLSKYSGLAVLDTIKVAVSKNTGLSRMDTIVITTRGGFGNPLTETIVITQAGAPPMLRLTSNNRETLAHDAESANAITFNIGGGSEGWSSEITYSEGADEFIMLTGDETMRRDVRVIVASKVNTGTERAATIRISTEGGTGDAVDTVITIIQEAIPTISVTDPSDGMISIDYNDTIAQTITFDVGGSATGWRVTSDNDFVTLLSMSGDSGRNISVTATTTKNRDVERTATITFITRGQLGDSVTAKVTITQEGAPGAPTLGITTPNGDTVVDYTATRTSDSVEIAFTVGNALGWASMISYGTGVDEFITLSDTVNAAQTGEVRIEAAVMENEGVERRATITLSTTGQTGFSAATRVITIIQRGAPPTFMLTSANTDTLAHNATVASAITFNVGGGATGWMSDFTYGEEADEFIMLTGDETMRGNVSVTVASEVNTGVERSAVIMITTVGGTGEAVDTVITIVQEAGPPKLTLTSGSAVSIVIPSATISTDSIEVIFTVGGGASGWMAEVIDRDNFLVLSKSSGLAVLDTIKVAVLENTGLSRMDTIVITTIGGFGDPLKETIVITQAGGPPMLRLISNNRDTLAHNATVVSAITFNIGGGAEGWSSEITYSEGTDGFIMLTGDGTMRGDVRLTVASEVNTGVERSATITISTTGPEATTPVTATLTITQGGAPPMLMLTSVDETIDHDAEAASDITFNVGGGATGWVNSIVYNPAMSTGGEEFITLTGDETMRGDVSVTVASEVNTGVERSAVITITTVGGTGDALSKTLTITQRGILPTLTLNSSNAVSIFHTATSSTDSIEVIFTVGGGATGWTATLPENSFLTLSKENGSTGLDTIKVAANENRGTEARMDTIVITAVGMGVAVVDTIIVTQGAMPTLELTSHNDGFTASIAYDMTTPITIEFIVGGGATGWTSSIVYNPELPIGTEGFITLTNNGTITGPVVVTATPTKNNGAARTATISFFTTGGSDRVTANKEIMIVQRKIPSPPALTIILPNQDITIGKDDTTSITIEFTVGGSATAWTANTDNPFITLNPTTGDAGSNITITATPEANTEATARTATITITTMGGVGDDASETVNITQSEGTPPLKVSPDNSLTLYPNPTTGKLTIEGISGDVQIYLHDFVGKEVFTSSLTSSRNTIDLSHLPSGMYVITLQGEEKTMTEVLIIVNY